MPSRRQFLATTGLAAVAAPLHRLRDDPPAPIRPPRLQPGDTVGLVSPAGAIFYPPDLDGVEEELSRLGLRVKRGPHALDRHGYLGGQDVARAADIMTMFRDPEVKAILPLRGGWGSARVLPLLDYSVIRDNPKIVCGYSDITSLLLAIYARSGVVTFHGPVGTSTWNPFSSDHFRRVLFDGQAYALQNRPDVFVDTITPGRARGRLAGGNLSVLAGIVGSRYVPDFSGHILFLEDVGEEPYRVDRMLTQLRLAGVFNGVTGVIFGDCRNCTPGSPTLSLSLRQVLDDQLKSLGVPAWYGSMIGHIADKFTVPLGVEAEIDASSGMIQLLEPAVA